MFTRKDREQFEQPTDQSGLTVAAGALALLYPLPPGEDSEPLSLRLTKSVRHCAAVTGERLSLAWMVKPHAASLELVRKPEGSSAELQNGQIVPDLRGVYVVRVWLGPWQRDVTIAAWARDDLLRMGKPPKPGHPDLHATDRRKRLQMLVNDPNVTAEKLAEALEGNADGCLGFAGTMGVTVSTAGW